MRKAISVVGAALLAVTSLATPAPAQAAHFGTLVGSCGPVAGQYGDTNVTDEEANNAGSTVPALFYQINYANIPVATTLGIIIRYNDELEDQRGLSSFTTPGGSGTFVGRFGTNISPEVQGAGTNFAKGGGAGGANHGRGDLSGRAQANRSQHQSGVQGGAALLPGDYHFYVYAGEIRDMPETVKDGPAGPRFIADESKFIGKFSCGADA